MNAIESNNVKTLTANLGSAQSYSLNQIADAIEVALGRTVERNYLPARVFDVKRTCLDISLAKAELEWEPRTPIQEGIKKVLAAYDAKDAEAGLNQNPLHPQ